MAGRQAKEKGGSRQDREDSFQDGRILIFLLIPKCEQRMQLTAYLKKSLPRLVAKLAKRRRRISWATVSLDSVGYAFAEERDQDGAVIQTGHALEGRELETAANADDELVWQAYGEVMRSVLTAEQIRMVQMRLEDKTHSQIAAELKLDRTTVTKRMAAIGGKMSPYLAKRGKGRRSA